MVSDMNIVEALRSVRLGLLEYIQERVFVGFDGICWIPVYFTYRKKATLSKLSLAVSEHGQIATQMLSW